MESSSSGAAGSTPTQADSSSSVPSQAKAKASSSDSGLSAAGQAAAEVLAQMQRRPAAAKGQIDPNKAGIQLIGRAQQTKRSGDDKDASAMPPPPAPKARKVYGAMLPPKATPARARDADEAASGETGEPDS